MELRRCAKMPLAETARGIAGAFQLRGQSLFREWEPNLGIQILLADHISFVPKTRLVAACHQPGARWRTVWRAHVRVGETHPVSGNGIDMRCLDLRIALATKFAITEVVGQYHDDIRLTRRRAKHDRE